MYLAVFLAVILAGLAGSSAHAIVTLGPDGAEILTGSEAQQAKLLAPEFRDERSGFRICPPAGVRIIQRDALELFSFVQDNKQWAGSVQLMTSPKESLPVEEYLKSAVADLATKTAAVQVLESKAITVGPEKRPAGKLVVSFEAQAVVWNGPAKGPANGPVPGGGQQPVVAGKAAFLRQDCAVQMFKNQYTVLTMMAPLSAKDEAIATFNAMIDSFEVYDRQQVFEHRLAAIKKGREWLGTIVPEDLTSKLVNKPQVFRIRVDNKDAGYLRFDEMENNYAGFKGISFIASSRTFRDDGSIVMVENLSFWAYSKQPNMSQELRFSRWESAVQNTMFVGNAMQAAWSTELGILQYEAPRADHAHPEQPLAPGYYSLQVTRTSGNSGNVITPDSNPRPQQWQFPPPLDPSNPPKPGTVEPLPLPRILEYVWPRLVDLTKTDTQMAFTAYNSTTAKLGLRTLSVVGTDTVAIDGQSIKATKLINEIDPGYTTIWVDNTGKILAMRSSDNTLLVPTTLAEMQRVWAVRLAKLPAGQDALGPATRSMQPH